MTEQDEQNNALPPCQVREGWDEAFAEMAEKGDDRMLNEIPETGWEDEWDWQIFPCN